MVSCSFEPMNKKNLTSHAVVDGLGPTDRPSLNAAGSPCLVANGANLALARVVSSAASRKGAGNDGMGAQNSGKDDRSECLHVEGFRCSQGDTTGVELILSDDDVCKPETRQEESSFIDELIVYELY
jgi:hypothetical protein